MQKVPRLIEKFKPISYQLSLNIDRPHRLFKGLVTISGNITSNDGQFTLHSKDLEINSVNADGKSAQYEIQNDYLHISHNDLKKGKHLIVISFSGKINDSMHGIYPCYYRQDDEMHELIATQFESHHAREVFPCIDEPEAKATFELTLTTETEVEVLSNMPVQDQRLEDNFLVTSFEKTPPMSTYLLAWVIGKLHKKTATTNNGVVVNVWATPNQSLDNLDFALDIAKRSIEFFDDYFQTPYPLPKCDHVALPDFAAGAMENWGLITYREVALLADPVKTSLSNKQYIATVIAHELSHQWFGNLVTMKWWDDLWLNESFASLIEYMAIDVIEPSWDVWMDFASLDVVAAFKRDSLKGVQPVRVDVSHPDEIGTLFDGAIVYAKGAHLLQMLRFFVGEENFRQGLIKYFKKFAYKNTEADDLWEILSETSHKDVGAFMNRWLNQSGFPVLKVAKKGKKILISQIPISEDTNDVNKIWPICLNHNLKNEASLLNANSLELNCPPDQETIRFNIGNYGHFITDYDENLLNEILVDLDNNKLKSIDRLQLLNEQMILSSVGYVSNARIIEIISRFKNEDSEQVWDLILIAINELKKIVEEESEAETKLKQLVNKLIDKQYKRLGWHRQTDENESDTKLRNIILNLAIYAQNPDAIENAIHIFDSSNIKDFDPNIRSLIISGAVQYSTDRKLFKNLINQYKNTNSSEIQQSISVGLTSARRNSEIQFLLSIIKDKTIIRTQDVSRWLTYLIRNRYAKLETWQWIKNNWQWIENTFEGDKSYDEYPKYIAYSFNTRKLLEEYKTFFEPLTKNPALKRVITIGINEISQRVQLIEKDSKTIIETLKKLDL